MNKFQKLICQMGKDDFKKPDFLSMCGLNFRTNRNEWRKFLKDKPLERIRDFKNYNKNLNI